MAKAKDQTNTSSVSQLLIFLTAIVPLLTIIFGVFQFIANAQSERKLNETKEFVAAFDAFQTEATKAQTKPCRREYQNHRDARRLGKTYTIPIECRADVYTQTVALARMGENKTYCATVIRMASQKYCQLPKTHFRRDNLNVPVNMLAIEF